VTEDTQPPPLRLTGFKVLHHRPALEELLLLQVSKGDEVIGYQAPLFPRVMVHGDASPQLSTLALCHRRQHSANQHFVGRVPTESRTVHRDELDSPVLQDRHRGERVGRIPENPVGIHHDDDVSWRTTGHQVHSLRPLGEGNLAGRLGGVLKEGRLPVFVGGELVVRVELPIPLPPTEDHMFLGVQGRIVNHLPILHGLSAQLQDVAHSNVSPDDWHVCILKKRVGFEPTSPGLEDRCSIR
jgi:hypothetical protein